jgi:amino acid transporter
MEDSGTVSAAEAQPEQLKREFSFISALGLGVVFVSPVVALYSVFALTIMAAGGMAWWAFLIGLGGTMFIALGFAEASSRWPLAGGLYQWSRKLVGPSYGWFASWTYSWTLFIGIALAAYVAAGFVPIVLDTSPFTPTETFVVALGILALCTLINALSQRAIKVFIAFSVLAEVIGSIGIGIVLIVFFRVNPISTIFESFGAGWGEGPDLWSGLIAAVAFVGWTFVAFEAAGDIAEEVENPQRAVPKAIIGALTSVGAIVLFSSLALILAIPDWDAVISGQVMDPAAETIAYHLGDSVARPLFALFILSFMAAVVAAQTSVSRVVWANARDGVLPGSRYLARLNGRTRLPVNAILLAFVLAGCVLLLSFADDVYATLLSFAAIGYMLSFAFPTLALFAKKVRGQWEPGAFSLGRIRGLLVTAVATVFVLFQIVNIAWPRDVGQAWYLKWGVVITVSVIAGLGFVVWWSYRKQIAASVGEVDLQRLDEAGANAPGIGLAPEKPAEG